MEPWARGAAPPGPSPIAWCAWDAPAASVKGVEMPHRVFLHVGSPKTGTTFLQHVLWSQRDLARRQGLLLPLGSFQDHFLASVDVRELSYEPRFPARAIGIWTRLAEEGTAWGGNVLVSHELFAATTAAQAVRAVREWGNANVHVVVTARDLERQIPAEWQEHLKHRSAVTFADFVEELRTRGPRASWFWTVQDCADICRRWGAAVPPEKIHVVTVPPRGSRPEALWERFAGLIGLEPETFDLEWSAANLSLRAEQAELLRRVNAQLGQRLPLPGPYPETVKEIFAQEVLAGRDGERVALSGVNRAFAVQRSAQMVDELRDLGVHVVGDLDELVPPAAAPEPGGATDDPESLAAEVLLDESVEALSDLLVRLSDHRRRAKEFRQQETAQRTTLTELADLTRQHAQLRKEHEELLVNMGIRPLRRAVIAMTERRTTLMRLRVAYWRAMNLARRLKGRRWGA